MVRAFISPVPIRLPWAGEVTGSEQFCLFFQVLALFPPSQPSDPGPHLPVHPAQTFVSHAFLRQLSQVALT